MLNNVTFAGRFTSDPELKSTPSGTEVTSFTLAVDRDFKNQNGERETDFFTVVAWKYNATFVAKHFQKGDMAIVSGRLQSRKWTDKEGNKRSSVEVVAENVYFCGKKQSNTNFDQLEHKVSEFQEMDDEPGDLPF